MKLVSNLNYVLLCLCMSLFITACGGDKAPEETTPEMIVLNDDNITVFTLRFAKEYIHTLNKLISGFHEAKKSNSSYNFVLYRNKTWTPEYIERKHYYEAILKNNSAYIATSPVKPLFDKFSSLIFIGINLKNGLLDQDQDKLQKTMITIEEDKAVVKAIIKSAS